MNDLGSLATSIVNFNYETETGRFPVSFVSGWLEANIGLLNGITHEEFVINSTGAFEPFPLEPVEESIFSLLYDIYYYNKASRYVLRGITWDGSLGASMMMVKEGDTTLQMTSKHQISRSFAEMARAAQESLDNLVYQYNMTKAAPSQVVGDNDHFYDSSWDKQV